MKNIIKKIMCCLVLFASINLNSGIVSYAKEETSENFNFIKSEEELESFIYDGSLLLYGGIALISISIGGMVMTFLPQNKSKRGNRYSNLRHKK